MGFKVVRTPMGPPRLPRGAAKAAKRAGATAKRARELATNPPDVRTQATPPAANSPAARGALLHVSVLGAAAKSRARAALPENNVLERAPKMARFGALF